jgi:hypothetical protein
MTGAVCAWDLNFLINQHRSLVSNDEVWTGAVPSFLHRRPAFPPLVLNVCSLPGNGAQLDLSDYFSLGACMEGINLVISELFGVSLQPVEPAAQEVRDGLGVAPCKHRASGCLNVADPHAQLWDPSVIKCILKDLRTDDLLGVVYCDFFDRPAKNAHPTKYTLQSPRRANPMHGWETQLPVIAVVRARLAYRPRPHTKPLSTSLTLLLPSAPTASVSDPPSLCAQAFLVTGDAWVV